MVNPWNIATGGGIIVCSKERRKSLAVIYGREFLTNLIVIKDSGFDVVLGMDWLGTPMLLLTVGRRKLLFGSPVIQNLNSMLGM